MSIKKSITPIKFNDISTEEASKRFKNDIKVLLFLKEQDLEYALKKENSHQFTAWQLILMKMLYNTLKKPDDRNTRGLAKLLMYMNYDNDYGVYDGSAIDYAEIVKEISEAVQNISIE